MCIKVILLILSLIVLWVSFNRLGCVKCDFTRFVKHMDSNITDSSIYHSDGNPLPTSSDDCGSSFIQDEESKSNDSVRLSKRPRLQSVNSCDDSLCSRSSTPSPSIYNSDSIVDSLHSEMSVQAICVPITLQATLQSTELSYSENFGTDSDPERDSYEQVDTSSFEDSDSDYPLYPQAKITVCEAVMHILRMYVQKKRTKTDVQDELKFLQQILPEYNTMPRSFNELKKFLSNHCPDIIEKKHIHCKECSGRKSGSSKKCPNCNKNTQSVTFFEFPVQDYIVHLFEHRGLSHILKNSDTRKKTLNSEDYIIADLHDGDVYKTLKINSCQGVYDLIFMWFTDGVSIAHSSSQTFWPLMITIGNVPSDLRRVFTFTIGLWSNPCKPKMNLFLEPFVDSLVEINKAGGVEWTHPGTKEKHKSLVFAPIVVADAPARADLLNMTNHMGMFACNICEQERKKDPTNDKKRKQCNQPPKKRSYFLFNHNSAPLRTHRSFLQYAEEVQNLPPTNSKKIRNVKGVKGRTILENIPGLDLGNCVYPEYMHALLLGVVLQITTLWFHEKGPWYLGDKEKEIDQFLLTIQKSDFLQRSPRSLNFLSKWKASELRAWLLFYSPIVIKKFGTQKYFQHWLLLVSSTSILLQNAITLADLDTAETMLKSFVEKIQILYRSRDYTYNMHQLLHLSLTVRRFGPLWGSSAFPYENLNGFLKNSMHGTLNQGQELSNTLKIFNGFKTLELKMRKGKEPEVNKILSQKLSIRDVPITCKNFMKSSGIHISEIFGKVRFKNEIFTGKLYDTELKDRNSYVELNASNTGTGYGEILFFFKTHPGENNEEINCLISPLKVDQLNHLYVLETRYRLKHLIPILETSSFIVTSVDNIKEKTFRVDNFLCKKPNDFENML